MLFGTGEVFDTATLRRLYPGGTADYLERFEAALDTAIRSGFIVPADRAEIVELAALMFPVGYGCRYRCRWRGHRIRRR